MSGLQASVFQLAFRGDTASRWQQFNPVLADRELVLETDTNQFKIGDGVTPYADLPYGGIIGPTGPTGDIGATGVEGPTGPTGPQGIQGLQGELGPTGPQGIQGVEGQQGDTGPTGPTGPQGAQGVSITIVGEVNTNGELPTTGNNVNDAYIVVDEGDLYVWDGTSWINVGPIVGPQGPTGSTGDTGAVGPTGPQGIQGVQGIQGDLGPTGPEGAQGLQGDTGPVGPTGATGLQGLEGPTGPTGAQGEEGLAGAQGPTGPLGPTGPVGASLNILGTLADELALPPTGANLNDAYIINGDLWVWDGSTWENVGNIEGPVGPTGPTGATGLQGPTGPTGATGPTGSTGDVGAVGPTGATGEGLVAGGATDQILTKASGTDYDTQWVSTIDASVLYDNSNSTLSSTLVQTAIDELDAKKLNTSALTASISFFPTTAAGDVAGYNKLVTSTDDADYDDPAVNVSTGTFSGADNLIGSLVSDAGVLEGNTTPINITTLGNVRRVTGNTNDAAEFYFEVYKRDSGGNETLIGTSLATRAVNQSTYEEFFATALISDTLFTETDRVVLKFYASVVAGPGGREYEFQYGGDTPVRSLFPVPVTVVPQILDANDIIVDASGFSGLLSGTDDDVQAALGTLDAVNATDISYDSSANELTATDVQNALDEIIEKSRLAKYLYTATANQTIFTGADDFNEVLAYSPNHLDVFINGVRLTSADYTATNGTSVVLDTGTIAGDEVAITVYGFVLSSSLEDISQVFTATVTGSNGTSDWTGSDPYIATITVSGILSTDTPLVDLDMSSVTFADVPAVVSDFGLVYRVEASADDEIKLYATAEPAEDFDLTIQVNR